MSKKKELKKLLERVEAIEAEIKAFKETAEKNVATISAEIEKLVEASKPAAETPVKRTRKSAAKAPAEKPTKPARKPRAKKAEAKKEQPIVQEKTAAPEQVNEKSAPAKEPAPAEEKQKVTRTRKPRATTAKEPVKRTRTWKGASFVLYNCDEAKSPESLFNRNDETFKDAGTGRRALWSKLKTEIAEGRIKILDNVPMDNIRIEIIDGKPESVSKHLQYGLIEKVETNQ